MSFGIVSQFNNQTPVTVPSAWPGTYKDTFIEKVHDFSQLDLVTPDHSLVVMGPARLTTADEGSDSFYPVGFLQGISYTETRQAQPLKGIGSYRHIFAATNSPVQIQISRLMFNGNNLYMAMYGALIDKSRKPNGSLSVTYKADSDDPRDVTDVNERLEAGNWFTNIEEDLFRIPFGMGVIYKNPDVLRKTDTNSKVVGAEYFECCTFVNRSVSLQSGQATIMEQVSLMCDRVVPFTGYAADAQEYGFGTEVAKKQAEAASNSSS